MAAAGEAASPATSLRDAPPGSHGKDAEPVPGLRSRGLAGVVTEAELMSALRPTIMLLLMAGNMALQARPLLAVQSAGDPEAAARARTQLANAASLGSLGEFLMGPLFGRLSDQIGRKPFLAFHVLAPTAAWLAVCASGSSPMARLRLLYLDMFATRGFGMMSFIGMASVAVSDIVAPAAQPRARASLASFRAMGVVLGSLLGGWAMGRRGPAAPYGLSVALASLAAANVVLRQPETLSRKVDSLGLGFLEHTVQAKEQKRSSALQVLLRDPEARPLTLLLGIQEMTVLPQFSDVATLLFRDLLQWGPAAAGRFVAAFGMANILGSGITGALVDRLGPEWQTTLSHAALTASFLLWGAARRTATMVVALPLLALSFGRGAVVQSQALARGEELGLGRGEAMAAIQTVGAVAKILAPRIFVALYAASSAPVAAVAGAPKRGRSLPPGSPMFFIAILGVLCEAFHRKALGARSTRART
mmetsp:Transcript_74976/g.237067  ORF Transcript_74976/g.237067 Transcript_74976/m.237067 type:complete len:476 (-) Transcript_74976:35-1462(-)